MEITSEWTKWLGRKSFLKFVAKDSEWAIIWSSKTGKPTKSGIVYRRRGWRDCRQYSCRYAPELEQGQPGAPRALQDVPTQELVDTLNSNGMRKSAEVLGCGFSTIKREVTRRGVKYNQDTKTWS